MLLPVVAYGFVSYLLSLKIPYLQGREGSSSSSGTIYVLPRKKRPLYIPLLWPATRRNPPDLL
jgi:hypothetical protein